MQIGFHSILYTRYLFQFCRFANTVVHKQDNQLHVHDNSSMDMVVLVTIGNNTQQSIIL